MIVAERPPHLLLAEFQGLRVSRAQPRAPHLESLVSGLVILARHWQIANLVTFQDFRTSEKHNNFFQKCFSDIVQILSRLVGIPWRRREVAKITIIASNGRPENQKISQYIAYI